jgi:hypothetical protein
MPIGKLSTDRMGPLFAHQPAQLTDDLAARGLLTEDQACHRDEHQALASRLSNPLLASTVRHTIGGQQFLSPPTEHGIQVMQIEPLATQAIEDRSLLEANMRAQLLPQMRDQVVIAGSLGLRGLDLTDEVTQRHVIRQGHVDRQRVREAAAHGGVEDLGFQRVVHRHHRADQLRQPQPRADRRRLEDHLLVGCKQFFGLFVVAAKKLEGIARRRSDAGSAIGGKN